MNTVLLRDPAARWRLRRRTPAVKVSAVWFAPPPEKSLLRRAQVLLRREVVRALADHALQRVRLVWILTSPEIIHGRFTGGLTVGVVPMHVVTRFRFEGWDEPLVSHDAANQSG